MHDLLVVSVFIAWRSSRGRYWQPPFPCAVLHMASYRAFFQKNEVAAGIPFAGMGAGGGGHSYYQRQAAKATGDGVCGSVGS